MYVRRYIRRYIRTHIQYVQVTYRCSCVKRDGVNEVHHLVRVGKGPVHWRWHCCHNIRDTVTLLRDEDETNCGSGRLPCCTALTDVLYIHTYIHTYVRTYICTLEHSHTLHSECNRHSNCTPMCVHCQYYDKDLKQRMFRNTLYACTVQQVAK